MLYTSLICQSVVRTVKASLPPTQPNNRGRVDKEDFESSLKKERALTSHCVCACACLCVHYRGTQTLKQRPCLFFCHSYAQCYSNDSEEAVSVKDSFCNGKSLPAVQSTDAAEHCQTQTHSLCHS